MLINFKGSEDVPFIVFKLLLYLETFALLVCAIHIYIDKHIHICVHTHIYITHMPNVRELHINVNIWGLFSLYYSSVILTSISIP